ncbi:MAG: hypothetical protein AMS26_18260 [Bacteroides sp. SM23_62]|nr:MAG: hypothetical protein AMS26_18260 [Bacteroides sp. SM23_62]
MSNVDIKTNILNNLKDKSAVKQQVYDNTLSVLSDIKKILKELELEFNTKLVDADERIQLDYQDNGIYSAQLKIAGDLIIIAMHSNVFEFDMSHGIWKTSYVQSDRTASYCGIINIYNFLLDSFKYSRMQDLGYLVGRIFINKEFHYFAEGKRQLGFFFNDFGNKVLDKESLTNMITLAINYTLEFDLLVPPYDTVKIASVEQISDRIQLSKLRTGKRLGFQFNADDIDGNL